MLRPFTSVPGSTVLTFGFFSIANGTRISVPRPNRAPSASSPSNPSTNSATYFMNYQTTFQCQLGDFVAAEARVYSPPNDVPLPDNTVVFLVGRACTSNSGTALIDVIHIKPCPGDPSDPSYDLHIPDLPYPFLCFLGMVLGPGEELGDGSRAFSVEASAHVCDRRRTSFLKCVFELSSARWRNMRTPNALSMVHVLGMCRHVAPGDQLAISISDITLNAAPPPAPFQGGPPGSGGSGPSTPLKRRRFNALIPGTPTASAGGHARTDPSVTSPSTVCASTSTAESAPTQPTPSPAVVQEDSSDLSDLYASDHEHAETSTPAAVQVPDTPRARNGQGKSKGKGKARATD